MHILILSESVPSAPTGIRVHYANLAAHLKASGHQVEVVTPADVPRPIHYLLAVYTRTLAHFGSAIHEFVYETDKMARLYLALLFRRKTRYDIVNAQEICSGVIAKSVFKNKIPVAVTCHFNDDPASEKIERRALTGFAARLVKKWYGYLFRQIDYFNGVSNYVLQKPRHLFRTDAVAALIHNSIDFQKIKDTPPDEAFRQQHAGKKIIMNIGYFEKRKNQQLIIQVARLLKDKRQDLLFVLLGDGDDFDKIKGMVEAHRLQESVLLPGRIENVVSLLKCADLYLHTALNESFGLVITEAIACRVPVKALAVGGIPELVYEKQSLLDADARPEQVAAAVVEALDNTDKTLELERRQYAYAVQRFHIDTMTKNYLAFYKQVIAHFSSRRKPLTAIAKPAAVAVDTLKERELKNSA